VTSAIFLFTGIIRVIQVEPADTEVLLFLKGVKISSRLVIAGILIQAFATEFVVGDIHAIVDNGNSNS
jgi:hypothetical protein